MANVNTKPPKAAMLVAQRIVRDIVRGGLQPGELLPPERTMLDTYDTGRGTLREALRLLEFQGVIALKPGPGGGPVLLDRGSSNLASSVRLLMQLDQAPYGVLLDARMAIEPTISKLAAERITEQSLDEIRETIVAMRDNMTDQDAFFDANRDFHRLIAWSSDNALFGHLLVSMLDILDSAYTTVELAADHRDAIAHSHDEVFAALAAHDPAAAQEAMRVHIDELTTYARGHAPEAFEQIISWDRR